MKNFVLLLRSLANISAFGLTLYGLAERPLLAILGGAATAACIYFNLIRPLRR